MKNLPDHLKNLNLEFQQRLVPSVSQDRYHQEWNKYWIFLRANDVEAQVNSATLESYLVKLKYDGLSPPTLRTCCSI